MGSMMKKLKRRLSWTLKGSNSRPLDDSLSELAEHLSIEDTANGTNCTVTDTTANATSHRPAHLNPRLFERPMSAPLQHNGKYWLSLPM